MQLRSPIAAVGLVGIGGTRTAHLGSPSIKSADGTVYTVDGQLQAALVPPRWRFRDVDGSFGVFDDIFAVAALSLRPLPGHRDISGAASVRLVEGSPFSTATAAVSSEHGVEVIRSVAAIPGWNTTWHPRSGATVHLPVHRRGLVQGVDVPAGEGILSWTYDPPGWTTGWILAVCALCVLLLLITAAFAFEGASLHHGVTFRSRRIDRNG